MLRFVLCSWLFLILSCTHSGSSNKSSFWLDRQDIADVSCRSWPLGEKMLAIEDITRLDGKRFAFVATARQRNGRRESYFIPSNEDLDLDEENYRKLKFGSDGLFTGGGYFKNRPYVSLFQQPHLEIRSLPDNVVRVKSDSMKSELEDGRTYFVKNGFWFIFKKASKKYSKEEIPFQAAFFTIAGKKASFQSSKKSVPANAAFVLAKNDGSSAWFVWPSKSGKKYFLNFQSLTNSKGVFGPKYQTEIPVESNLESWAIARRSGSYVFAFVDGDSLVGQSHLKISRLEVDGKYTRFVWTKKLSLINEHVSDPLWLSSRGRSILLLPKWLEGDATLAAYEVNESGIKKATAHGVFPKGIRVADAFMNKDGVYSLIRKRHRYKWQFDLCELEEL